MEVILQLTKRMLFFADMGDKKFFGDWSRAALVAIATFFVILAANYFITGGWIFFGQKPEGATLSFDNYDAVADRAHWSERIDAVEPRKVLKELKYKYDAVKDFRIQHTAVHIIGELFYIKLGLEGIAHCDDTYNFGCYHSFFANAIDIEGISALSRIDKTCNEARFSKERVNCYHGVGHGLVAHFGYDAKGLRDALEACDRFSFKKIGVCDGGVFMEHNFMFLRHTPNIFSGEIRPAGNDIYAPCSQLPKKFQAGCYLSQPDWWAAIFEHDYKKVGELCATVDTAYRHNCFWGIGKIIVWFQPKLTFKANDICGLMPDTDTTSCLAGAVATVYDRTLDKDLASSICDGLDADNKKLCLLSLKKPP